MIKKRWYFIVFFLIISMYPSMQIEAAENKGHAYEIEELHMHLKIKNNGDIDVYEQFTYQFNGSYNGATRTIEDDGHGGIENFEAFESAGVSPNMQQKDQELDPLPVSQDHNEFRIHRPSYNEEVSFFYTYTIKEGTTKFKDVGEFYWRFFDKNNDTDIHHIQIEMELFDEENIIPDILHGAMHEQFGGKYWMESNTFFYMNDFLPKKNLLELRMLFPSEFLSAMDYTKSKSMLQNFLKQEKRYDQRYAINQKSLPLMDKANLIFYPILGIIILYGIFLWFRSFKARKTPVSMKKIKETDSLTLNVIHHQLQILPSSIYSALFSLYQRQYVVIDYIPVTYKKFHWYKNIDHTFMFTLVKDISNLAKHEQFLMNWLFTDNGTGTKVFTFENIPRFLAEHTQAEKKIVKEAMKDFDTQFKKWKKLLLQDNNMRTFIQPIKLQKYLMYGILPIWILSFIVTTWIGFASADHQLKILYVQLLIGYVLIVFVRESHKWWQLCIFMMVLLFISFYKNDMFFGNLPILYGSIVPLFIALITIPNKMLTKEGIKLAKGINLWKHQLRHGKIPLPTNAKDVERMFQHVIAIESEDQFITQFSEKIETTDMINLYPLLIDPQMTTDIYIDLGQQLSFVLRAGGSSNSGGSSSGGRSSGGGGAGAF